MIHIKKIYNYFTKIYISIILFIALSIILNNDNYYKRLEPIIFSSNIDFQYIKSKSKYLLGNLVNNKEVFVSGEKFNAKSIEKIDNSYKIELDYNYVINNKVSGIVTFIGNKESLGMTVIVSGDDGVNYWYSNIENISVNLYDYINKGTILGSVKENYLILTMMKNNTYLNYEDIN